MSFNPSTSVIFIVHFKGSIQINFLSYKTDNEKINNNTSNITTEIILLDVEKDYI